MYLFSCLVVYLDTDCRLCSTSCGDICFVDVDLHVMIKYIYVSVKVLVLVKDYVLVVGNV